MPSSSPSPVTLDQLTALNDEIAALVRAGVPLELGLRGVAGDSGGALGAISRSLSERMQAGQSLSEALAAEEERIPPVYRAVVEAGARAGRLPAALEAVSNYTRELMELRRQIGTAMVYPLMVFALAYGLFLVFTVHLIELFRETYEMMRIPMRFGMTLLSNLADHVNVWWWGPPLLAGALVVWWVAGGGVRTLNVGAAIRPLHLIPGTRRISRYFQCANFSDLLALLMEQQVPLSEGLRLAAAATGDPRLQASSSYLAEGIERGQPAEELKTGASDFPPFLFWVLCQASRGPTPVRMLRHAAEFYRRRAISLTNWFKLVFPMLAALIVGGGITIVYALTVFGPLAELWSGLTLE
jgi:general secretion pathway protein F